MVRTDAPSHEMVMSLLCSTAEKVHNQDLSALVTKVEEDPLNGTGFVKVRTFIEELILRLQKESQEEQSHDSWCKSETSKAATLKTEAQVSCYEAAAELRFFRGLFFLCGACRN